MMNTELERLAREAEEAEAVAEEKQLAYHKAMKADHERQMAVLQDLYRDGTLTDSFLNSGLLLNLSVVNEITGLDKEIAAQQAASGDDEKNMTWTKTL